MEVGEGRELKVCACVCVCDKDMAWVEISTLFQGGISQVTKMKGSGKC